MAACKLAAWGFPVGFVLEGSSVTTWGAFWSVCLKLFVFLQHVTAAGLTGCRTGRDHLPTPTRSKK